MTDAQRRTIATIQTWVLEENWSLERLNMIVRFLNALQWSEETDKIARAFDGLVKEIIHRDMALYHQEDKPFQLLLKPMEARTVEEAIQGRNQERIF
jgi:hypothetical protein